MSIKYDSDGNVNVNIEFSKSDIKFIRSKFTIKNTEDLVDAVQEMIITYMEL